MARANTQWESFSESNRVLAIFQGPNAYISPSWYLSPGVPTWNYVSVHISGKPNTLAGEEAVLSIICNLTEKYESEIDSNWKIDVPAKKSEQLLSMIVGFEIEVTTIEEKYKLSQNRLGEDHMAIIEKLKTESIEIAELMKQGLEK